MKTLATIELDAAQDGVIEGERGRLVLGLDGRIKCIRENGDVENVGQVIQTPRPEKGPNFGDEDAARKYIEMVWGRGWDLRWE